MVYYFFTIWILIKYYHKYLFYVLEKDIIGYDSKTSRLLLMASASDYEENMPLSSSLLRKCSNLTLCSKLLDSHMYVMKRWLISYLVKDKWVKLFYLF